MINVVNVSNERITGSVAGVPFNVDYTEEKYSALKEIETAVEDCEEMAEVIAFVENFKALLVESVKDKVESEIPNIYVDEKTDEFFLKQNDVISSIPIPPVLVDDLLYCLDNGLKIDPIIKFWARLLRNPNIRTSYDANQWADLICGYTTLTFVSPKLVEQLIENGYSEEKAYSMASVRQTPLTMEGLISTKKVVTPLVSKFVLDEEGNPQIVSKYTETKTIDENTGEISTEIDSPEFSEEWSFEPFIYGQGGDAFNCGDEGLGHTIKVGSEMFLDEWNQVDCDHNRTCVKGIHTGNQDYINGYESEGSVTLNCFVDPAMIGAIAAGDSVLRVKALFPHSIKNREEENRNIYHSSTYASKQDEEWSIYIKEATEKFTEERAKDNAEADSEVIELNSL